MATTINTTENTVSVTSAENEITVTNNNTGTSVSITGVDSTSVSIGDTGPQGATGPQGTPGSVEDTITADNIIQPFTNVTASANISASGTIIASNLSGTNTGDQTDITGNAGTADQVDTIQTTSENQHFITFVDSNNSTATPESVFTNNFLQVYPSKRFVTIEGKLLVQGSSISLESGSISASNNIFAAGDITASGNLSANGTGSFGSVNVDGDVNVNRYIRHTGDKDTHIEFLNNKLQLHAGNLPFITLDKDASSPYPLTINNGGNKINFRVLDNDSELLFKTNSEEGWAGLYFKGNQKLVTAAGGIDVTGNITASGNISSSGTIVASSFTGDGSGLTGVTSYTDADTLDFINSINIISSSAQIATDISGSFTSFRIENVELSSSLESRLSSVEAGSTSKTLLSGSAQIATEISGAFIAPSSSFSTRVSTLETNNTGTNTGDQDLSTYALIAKISGSLGPNATLIRSLTSNSISGSVTSLSSSLETRLSNVEAGSTNKTLLSGSAQIATEISGAFIAPSASFSTRITTNEAKVGYTDSLVKTKLNAEGVFSGSSQVSLTGFDTDNLSEGSSNLYYTDARVKTKLNTENVISSSAQIATEISESLGSNATLIRSLTATSISGSLGPNATLIRSLTATSISESFVAPSSSFSTRVTTLEGNVGQAVNTNSNVTFTSVTANSINVTSITSSFITASVIETSGSNIFGDEASDSHTFIGSITASSHISASGNITALNLSGTNTGDQDLSSYALIAKISGSFVAPSSSFSSRVSTLETNNTGTNTGDQNISNLAVTGSNVTFAQITGSNIIATGYVSASRLVASTISHSPNGDDRIVLQNDFLQIYGGTGGSEKIFFTVDDLSDRIIVNNNGHDIDFQINTDNSRALFVNGGDDRVFIGNNYNNFNPLPLFYSNAVENRFTSTVNIANYGYAKSSLNESFPEFALMSGSILRVLGHTPPSYNAISASIHVSSSLGTTFIDDGTITLSGNINATGDVEANSYQIQGKSAITYNGGNTRIIYGQNNQHSRLRGATITIGDSATQHITASADISASGNLIISESLTFGSDVARIGAAGEIQLRGSVTGNEYLKVTDNAAVIFIQGSGVLNVDEDSINLNASNQDIDVKITHDDAVNAFHSDASTNRVKIRDFVTIGSGSAPNADPNALHVEGTQFNSSHITASGNISSSGTITANAFVGDGSGLTGLSAAAITSTANGADNRIATYTDTDSLNGEANLTFDGTSLDVTGNITASGAISASGGLVGTLTGTATSASRALASNKVYTSQDNSDAEHFVTFVDSNNAVHADEDVHTTNFLRVNPQQRILIVEGAIKIPGSDITLESGSISASRDIFAPAITASGTISSSGDIHSATIRYVANIHDSSNNRMIAGTATALELGDVDASSNRTRIQINDSARGFIFTSNETDEQSYNMPGVVTTNMVRTKNLRGQSPLVIDPTSVIISASKEFALGVGGVTSSLFLSASITGSDGRPRIGFNTKDPQTDFDVSAREVQFQRPGTRKGLKINEEGNIESFNKDAASAATGSEVILKYSRGVSVSKNSMDTFFGAETFVDDAAAVTFFNEQTTDKQSSILEQLEELGFIEVPSPGDTIGSIRFVAESGSAGFDARIAGEAASIKSVVHTAGATGIRGDLIFSVADVTGTSNQRFLLDAGDNHQITGSLTIGGSSTTAGDITLEGPTGNHMGGIFRYGSNSADQKIGRLLLYDDGTQKIRLSSKGFSFITATSDGVSDNTRLGIGTQSPGDDYMLDIAGVTNIQNNLIVTGSITAASINLIDTNTDMEIGRDLLPSSDTVGTLGTATRRFEDVFSVQTTTGGVFEVGLRTKDIGKLETGTIVSWKDGKCIPCYKSEDNMVMGVIKQGKDEPIVLGAEPVLVTGKVEEGDYIVTSDVAGHGKAAKEGYIFKKNLFGRVIAQALESAEGDSSLIKCMIRKM